MALLFFFLAGAFMGTMDTLSFHYSISIFSTFSERWQKFWNPDLSWKNKYKEGDPEQGPKFKWSTTALVGLTDGWHLMQTLMLTSFFLAAMFYKPLFNSIWLEIPALYVLYRAAFGGGFYITYYKFLLK